MEQEVAKQRFFTLRRVLSAYKEGQSTDENVLNFFAGFCGYIPKEEDLKLSESNDDEDMKEERRGFYLDGETVWLTLTELQSWMSGAPTKHVLASWENGAKKEEADAQYKAEQEAEQDRLRGEGEAQAEAEAHEREERAHEEEQERG